MAPKKKDHKERNQVGIWEHWWSNCRCFMKAVAERQLSDVLCNLDIVNMYAMQQPEGECYEIKVDFLCTYRLEFIL